jgi:hypothetical protein
MTDRDPLNLRRALRRVAQRMHGRLRERASGVAQKRHDRWTAFL